MNRPEPSIHQVVVAEGAVTAYLKREAFAGAARIPRQGHSGEPQGIGGIPFTTVTVKYESIPDLQPWITGLLERRDIFGKPFCLLVVRSEGKGPQFWDAYLPPMWGLDYPSEPCPEREAWTWSRMDLRLAVVQLGNAIRTWSWAEMYTLDTGIPPTLSGIQEWLNAERPSRTV